MLTLAPSLVLAAEPSLQQWARQRVDEKVIQPLARVQKSAFSRARPQPRERRVRVLQTTTTKDGAGRAYVPFAVDVRFGSAWKEDLRGCVYRGSGEVFVKIGDEYRRASFLVGKRGEPIAGVCEAAAARS